MTLLNRWLWCLPWQFSPIIFQKKELGVTWNLKMMVSKRNLRISIYNGWFSDSMLNFRGVFPMITAPTAPEPSDRVTCHGAWHWWILAGCFLQNKNHWGIGTKKSPTKRLPLQVSLLYPTVGKGWFFSSTQSRARVFGYGYVASSLDFAEWNNCKKTKHLFKNTIAKERVENVNCSLRISLYKEVHIRNHLTWIFPAGHRVKELLGKRVMRISSHKKTLSNLGLDHSRYCVNGFMPSSLEPFHLSTQTASVRLRQIADLRNAMAAWFSRETRWRSGSKN